MPLRRFALLLLLSVQTSFSGGVYVSLEGNHIPPFGSPAHASTNIQAAVDLAANGDTVIIRDGHYLLSTFVAVSKSILIISENGPVNAVIDGDGITHCFDLADISCVISGLTITNGSNANGGGVSCNSLAPVITNCVVVGNAADDGGGVLGGRIFNSIIKENSALNYGGGVRDSEVHNSIVLSNIAMDLAGGAYNSTIYNSLIYSNQAVNFDGGAEECTLYNCTVVANSAGVDTGGVGFCDIFNTIVFDNSSPDQGDIFLSGNIISNSCSPDLTHGVDGNITNVPVFVDQLNGNYRLRQTSPCKNSGNNDFVSTLTDLDGNSRIVAGTVDMGAYEVQVTPTDQDGDGMLDEWEIQYFGSTNVLPNANGDTDEFTNLEEYIAGTDPTNSASFFEIASGSAENLSFEWWPSASNRLYSVYWTSNLTDGFTMLTNGIEYPQNSYTDTVHTAEPVGFYNVKVELQ